MADEGFKIADGYVEVIAKINEDAIDRSAKASGDRTGKTLGDSITDSTDAQLHKGNDRFVKSGERVGKQGFGRGFLGSLPSIGSKVGSALPGILGNAAMLTGVAAAGALLAPVLGGAITGGLMAGAGVGVIGLGAMILKEEKPVKKAMKVLTKAVKADMKRAAKPMMAPLVAGINEFTTILTGDKVFPLMKRMFAEAGKSIMPLTKGLGGFIEGLLPGMLTLVKASTPFLTSLSPSIASLGESIGMFLGVIAAGGPEATVFFKDLFVLLGFTIQQLAVGILAFTKFYSVVRSFFTSIPGWTSSAINWFKSLGSSISGFASGVASWFSGAASATGSFFSGIWSAISGFFGSIGSFFASIPGKIGGALSAAWSFISSWGSRIGAFFSALPGRIGSFLVSLPGILKNAFLTAMHGALFTVGFIIGSIIRYFIELPGLARAAVSTLWSAISGAFNAAKTGAINAGTALVNNVVNFFRALPGRARSAVSSLWSAISGAFTSAKSNATKTGRSLVDTVINFFRTLPGKARSAVSALWSSMSGAFSSAVSAARSKASQLVSGAIGYLRSLPGKARSALSGVRSAVTGAFAGAGSWLISAGANIMRGLASGIRSAVGAAVGAAKSAVGDVIGGAKSALGIRSPSKVAEKKVGRWFLPGVMRGVRRSLPRAVRDMRAATSALVPAAQIGLGGTNPNGKKYGATASFGNGTTYVFAAGSVTLDASKMKSIDDVVTLIGGLHRSTRTAYAAG